MANARDVKRHAQRVQQEAQRALAPAPVPDDPLVRFVDDPCGFAEALVDPETGEPFQLYPAERRFLVEALTRTPDGTLPCPELVFSAPKKSGKTALGALALLYAVRVIGGRFAEGYCVANDFDQAVGRVFRAAAKIVAASPLLRGTATVTTDEIRFADGATITALPSDYAGAAGANPTIVVFDELWAYTSERAHRLWDELVPVPTRRVSVRLTVTYAGFEGESDLLEGLHKRGLAGERLAPALYWADGLLMFWSHAPVAPWQTPAWLAQMRAQLRPNAYLRMIENRFVTSESGFVDPAWWAACEQADLRPVVVDRALAVWVGLDASVKRDQTAIVVVTWREDAKRVRLVWHRTFQPSPADPLDFEATIGQTLLALRQRFDVRQVHYDPYQMAAMAQRLAAAGLPMVEFPQTVANLTEASSCLYDLIQGRNLEAYPDAEVRLAVQRAIALETARGWRIAKEKAAHTIDVVVALAMASLAAVRGAAEPHSGFLAWMQHFDKNGVCQHDASCSVCHPAAAGAPAYPTGGGQPAPPAATRTVLRRGAPTSRRCPGCASVFSPNDAIETCPRCGTPGTAFVAGADPSAPAPPAAHLPTLLSPEPAPVASVLQQGNCGRCGAWMTYTTGPAGGRARCPSCGHEP